MKKSPLVLAIAVLLFGGWLAYLGVTALSNKKPVVVSRVQLALSQYDVEVDLTARAEGLPKHVTVKRVIWAVDANKPVGEINVPNLPSAQGYVGPGIYVLSLIRDGQDFRLAGIPSNLDPASPTRDPLPPRIYPNSSEVMRQWDQIRGAH